MHTYMVHTLVDITDNGLLRGEFPFKTKSGEVVHDKQSLFIARIFLIQNLVQHI